jgi:hypothetical protein
LGLWHASCLSFLTLDLGDPTTTAWDML